MVNLKLVKSLIKVLGKTDKINILVPGDSLEKILSSAKDLRQSDLSSVIFSLPHRLPMIVKPKLYKFSSPRVSSSTIATVETNKLKNTGFNTESGDDSQLVDQTLIVLTEANQSVQCGAVAQSKVSFSYAEQAQEQEQEQAQAQAQSVWDKAEYAEDDQLGGYLLNGIEYTDKIILPN